MSGEFFSQEDEDADLPVQVKEALIYMNSILNDDLAKKYADQSYTDLNKAIVKEIGTLRY
jgi:hypothetical protein